MRNFAGFETLPLVEFVPKAGLDAKRVHDLLKMDPPDDGNAGFKPSFAQKKP